MAHELDRLTAEIIRIGRSGSRHVGPHPFATRPRKRSCVHPTGSTPELANLEPGLTAELGEVFDRYGIVVVGYSGSDEGIARALRTRRSRYGLWWITRGEITQPAAELVETTAGRIVRRDSAAAFLADLSGRLRVFQDHPSGLTPAVVHDEILALVRAGDQIGLSETLRAEANAYESALNNLMDDAEALGQPTVERLRSIWSRLLPILERRLASLLPLGLYDSARLVDQARRLSSGLERLPLRGGYSIWIDIPAYSATWIGYIAGALFMRLEAFAAAGMLLLERWTDPNGTEQRLVFLPGQTSHAFGEALAESPEGGSRWLSSAWEHLSQSTHSLEWLSSRYPEVAGAEEPRRSLAAFDVLSAIVSALFSERSAAFFVLAGGAAGDFALRLRRRPALRAQVAEAIGLSLEDFDARASEAIRQSQGFPGAIRYPAEIAALLEPEPSGPS